MAAASGRFNAVVKSALRSRADTSAAKPPVASAPTVASIDSTTVTIVAGQYYTQAARWGPGIVGADAAALAAV